MDRIDAIDRYWYIYEAEEIDLRSGLWELRSQSGYDWDAATPEDRACYREMARTGWDGTGYWYERVQDRDRPASTYPLIQAVKHSETGKQHLLSLIPLPDRGEPRFVFYLPYMPFFIVPLERDDRYQQGVNL